MTQPGTAQLLKTFSVADFGGAVVKLADINGDGRQELLVMQTAGQMRSRIYLDRDDLDDADRDLYCLTAVDLDGNVLWQDGKPYEREMPFTSHGGSEMLLVEDIDADGAAEVAVIRGQELAILDGATGRCKSSFALPTDNMVSLSTAQLGPKEKGRHILCKVNDASYKPWQYANPTMIFNPDLTVFREPFAVRGAGHNVVARDLDGDGFDELLIGYSLFDHDLTEQWRLDLGEGFNYSHDHADEIALVDVDTDSPKIRYAGSEDFFVVDLKGNILWTTHAGHSQNSCEGKWGPHGEKRIIMNEKNRGLWCMDEGGEILWNRTDLNGYVIHNVRWHREGERTEWPLFRPQQRPFENTPLESDPADSPSLWPSFLDPDGEPCRVFPWRDGYAQPKRLIRAKRTYDCGVLYNLVVRDIDGDGLDEILVFDRYNVWLFRSPDA